MCASERGEKNSCAADTRASARARLENKKTAPPVRATPWKRSGMSEAGSYFVGTDWIVLMIRPATRYGSAAELGRRSSR